MPDADNIILLLFFNVMAFTCLRCEYDSETQLSHLTALNITSKIIPPIITNSLLFIYFWRKLIIFLF